MHSRTRLAAASLTFALLTLPASPARADYPIFYQRYTADPSGLEANGRLYLYCSHDVFDPSHVGYIMKDFTLISTDDLKNWTDHGEVFNVTTDSAWGATLAWAPSVIFRNNKYYMYYGNGDRNIGVAVSDSPTGPFKDTRSGPLVSASTPGVGTAAPNTYGLWIFDPAALIDDDGQAYLYFGGGGVGNDRVIKLNSDMVSVSGSAQKMNIPGFFEASFIHKFNGKYYFTCASHNYGTPARIDYSVSTSPMTSYQITGTVLPNPPNNASNNNHASIFTYQGSWYIAYHNREVATLNGVTDSTAIIYQRSVAIDRVTHNADGTIRQTPITKDGLTQLKNVNPYVTNEAETMAQEAGINTEPCAEGGRDVTLIGNGDWTRVRGVDFGAGATSFEARVASAGSGGNIEIRLDGSSGTLVGTCAVSGTGGAQTWVTKSCAVSGASGVHDVYFKFTGGTGSNLFNFNSWRFIGSGTGAGGSAGSAGAGGQGGSGGRGGGSGVGGSGGAAGRGGATGGGGVTGGSAGTGGQGGSGGSSGGGTGGAAGGGGAGGASTGGGAASGIGGTIGGASGTSGSGGIGSGGTTSAGTGGTVATGGQSGAVGGGSPGGTTGETDGPAGCACRVTARGGRAGVEGWLLLLGLRLCPVRRRRR
jgi:arabinoxylan arabinofuranohydrolase